VKFTHGEKAEHDEDNQDGALADEERRLRLGRRQIVQCRHFQEALEDQDEAVQVQRRRGGDHIDPAPGAGEMKQVIGPDRDGEKNELENADGARRVEAERRQRKAGGAGQNRRQQEQGGPAAERFAGQQAVENDQAGHDADQAQANVNSKQ
jgi:hypothetical protein